jgi:hypothetical protein
MDPDQMLRELERLARRIGIQVRVEGFDRHALRNGGYCTLRGAPLIVLDEGAPTIEKIGILCDALSRFDVELLYLPPLLRARIQRCP